MENSMEVPYKTENRAPIWSSNHTPWHISEKKKNHLKTYMHPSVHWSTIYNSQDREPTSVTIERWMDKEDVLYLHNGIVLSWQWKQCQTLFLGAPKSMQMVIAVVKLKDAYSLEGKLWPTWIAYLKAETLLCQQRSV